MSTLTVILAIALTGLFGWGMVLGFADAMMRRRYQDLLEIRDWTEKVEAMRRMADREGDA